MKNNIATFFKTNHFIQRQKEREILDNDIHSILTQVKKPTGKFAIITDCPRKGTSEKDQKLVIVAKKNVLITLFIADNPQRYMENTGIANFLFISSSKQLA